MQNPPNNWDIIQTIIQGIGLVSIVVATFQLWFSNKWKRIEFSVNGNLEENVDKNYLNVIELMKEGLFNIYEKRMTEDIAKEIQGNRGAIEILTNYFNSLEEIASMLDIKAIDKNYAYANFSARWIQTYEYFEKIITWICDNDKDIGEYMGIRKYYAKWKQMNIRNGIFSNIRANIINWKINNFLKNVDKNIAPTSISRE
jgi:uncharacterized protein YeeX (DUF496 family)